MRDSSVLLNDLPGLGRRLDEDGYLLLRGLLDRDAVLAAREEVLLKFAIAGEIDPLNYPLMDAIRSDHSFIDQVNLVAFSESVRSGLALLNVIHAPQLMKFFNGLMGGSVRTFDFRWPRFMRPGEATGIHCDAPYITRGTKNLWTAWVPIGDVSMIEGGLMVLEQSHKNQQLRESYADRDADVDNLGWLSKDPVELAGQLGGRWLSTDFRTGDVLVFGPYLVHGSLDNNSPESRCRLSCDSKYVLVGDELDERWNGDTSNPHGGKMRVFLPGKSIGSNKNFDDEWKEVDDYGRLV